jgi:hypothetical protein
MCTGHSFPASMVSSAELLLFVATVLTPGADATTSLTHTTPTPTSSPRPARRRRRVRRRCPRLRYSPLPPPLCCSTTPTATMRHPTLLVAVSPASSSFSQFLLGFFRAPFPGTRRLSCKQKSLPCSRYTSLRLAIHGKPPLHRVTRGSSMRYVCLCFPFVPPGFFPSCFHFNICSLADSLTALSLAPTSAACHAHTHHVRQRPRTATQPPPPPCKSAPPPPYTFAPTLCSRHGVECTQTRLCLRPPCLSPPPTAFLKAYALLSQRPVSDARTDRREATTSFLGELGGLSTGGDAIHPRRVRNLRLYGARTRLLGVALKAPLRVRRQHHGTFPRGCPQGCRLRRQIRTWSAS